MLKVTIGHSKDPDSESAISEIIEQCLEQCNADTPHPIAGLLLAAIDFDHQLILDRIHAVLFRRYSNPGGPWAQSFS